jgi:hypothetical protein
MGVITTHGVVGTVEPLGGGADAVVGADVDVALGGLDAGVELGELADVGGVGGVGEGAGGGVTIPAAFHVGAGSAANDVGGAAPPMTGVHWTKMVSAIALSWVPNAV